MSHLSDVSGFLYILTAEDTSKFRSGVGKGCVGLLLVC